MNNFFFSSDTREKLILAQDCELVTLMSAIKGRFELTNTHFYFHEIPSSSSSSSTERHDFVWPLNRLREVHLRRYNLRRSALEIFLTNQQNYFLNFTTKVNHLNLYGLSYLLKYTLVINVISFNFYFYLPLNCSKQKGNSLI